MRTPWLDLQNPALYDHLVFTQFSRLSKLPISVVSEAVSLPTNQEASGFGFSTFTLRGQAITAEKELRLTALADLL